MNVIKRKVNAALAAMGLGLAIASTPASAVIQFFSPATAFEDDNIDYVFDNNSNNVIDVGDRLFSVLEFNRTSGDVAGQGPTDIGPDQELTGIADLIVVAVLGDGTLVLAPSGAAGVLSGFAPGTAVVLWTDDSPDLEVINAECGTRATCSTLAGLGGADGSSVFATLGFFDPDNAWTSLPLAGGASIPTVQNGSSGQIFGAFNFNLTVGINNTGQVFGLQPCAPFCSGAGDGLAEVTGSGTILGGKGLNPAEWTARSDTDARVVPIQVPEPGTLALFGLALTVVGVGTMRRRSK